MKTKIAALALAGIALFVVAAKERGTTANLVEVGNSYLISNGSAAVKGKIVTDLGEGWFAVARADSGGTVAVNVAHAFFIQPVK